MEGQWGPAPGGSPPDLPLVPPGSGPRGVTDAAEQGRPGQHRAAGVAQRGEAAPGRPAGERGLGTSHADPSPKPPRHSQEEERPSGSTHHTAVAPPSCPRPTNCNPSPLSSARPAPALPSLSSPPNLPSGSPRRALPYPAALRPSLWWPISLQAPSPPTGHHVQRGLPQVLLQHPRGLTLMPPRLPSALPPCSSEPSCRLPVFQVTCKEAGCPLPEGRPSPGP